MITFYVGSSVEPRPVTASSEEILGDVLRENGVNISSGIIMHNQARLGDRELNSKIGALGIQNGDFITQTDKMASAR